MDDGSSPVWGLVIFIVLIIINTIFYGFGAAIQSINVKSIEEKAKNGDKRSERLLKMMENPSEYINTVQVVVTLADIIIGAYQVIWFQSILNRYLIIKFTSWNQWSIYFVSLVIVAILFVFILLIFGVFSPKIIASQKAERWAYFLAPIAQVSIIVLKPFTMLIVKTANIWVRIWGIDPYKLIDDVTEEEIISMVNEGQEQGVVLASEAEMIHNIFELDNTEAKDIMTHRKNMIAVDGNLTLDEVYVFMLDKNNSRFPVYDEDIDNILGIIHLRDVANCHMKQEMGNRKLKEIPELIREGEFVPETQNVNVIFKTMQSKKQHLVVVVDEYGQTAGLVAMEDILEEIVGNILDEYDEDEEFIIKQSESTYLVRGTTQLKDIEDILEIEFEDEEHETLNGFMIFKLNKIPDDDEIFELEYKNFLFKVLAVENKMIKTVQVTSCHEKETMIE